MTANPTEKYQSRLWVKDIKVDDQVRGLYLAKVKRVGLTKKKEPFLSITLADRTGEIEARMWERAEELSSVFVEGDVLDVEGFATSYRNRIQVTLSDLRVSGSGGDPTLFLEATPEDVTEMMTSLREIVKEINNSHLKALIDRFFSDRHFISFF